MRCLFIHLFLVLFPLLIYNQELCPTVPTSCQILDHSFLAEGSNHKWADLNNDNRLDLVQYETGQFAGGLISYYMNTGSGFNENNKENVVEGFIDASVGERYAIGDMDGNHMPDLVVIRSGLLGQSLQLLFNQGDNQFDISQIDHIINYPNNGIGNDSDPMVADVDNDGDQDILFCSQDCYLYINNGNGEFFLDEGFCLDLPSGFSFLPAQIADFDKDGYPDLIGTEAGFNQQEDLVENISVYYQFGFACNECLFQESLEYQKVHDIGDYDNDGDLDLLVTEQTTEFVVQSGISIISTVKILLNSFPDPGFIDAGIELVDDCTDDVIEAQWADIDNDGDLDLGVAQENNNAAVFRNDNGSHVKLFDFSEGFPDKSTIVFGDYNNDDEVDFCGSILDDGISATYYAEITSCGNNTEAEAPEVLSTHTFPGHGDVLLQWGQAEDDQIDASLTYNIDVRNGEVIVSPLSSQSQGIRDIVAIGAQSQNRFQRISSLETGMYNWKVQAIDHSYIGGNWSGEESFSVNNCFDLLDFVIREDIKAENIHVGDLVEESGAFPDILTGNQLIPNEGSLTFGSTLFLERSSNVLCRDLNGDNILDLIYYNDFSISIEIKQGDGQFRSVFSTQLGTSQPVVGDMDNDGDLDVLFSSGGDNVRIIRNEGGGNFILENFLLYSGNENGTRNTVELYDIDLDGDLDLISTFTPSIQVGFSSFYNLDWLENQEGILSDPIIIDNNLCGPLAIGDMDNDGDKDIVLASSDNCSISNVNKSGIALYLNDAGTFTEEVPEINPCPYFFIDVQVGDMDNDGFLDIIGLTGTQNFLDGESGSGNRLIVLRNDIGSIPDRYSYTEVFSREEVDYFTLGDIDLDRDLDIFYITCGNTCVHALVNDICIENTPPTAPTNLTCTEEDGYILLTWEAASDVEQADSSLTYQIEVYQLGKMDTLIISPESYRSDGQLKISRFGDQCENLSWRIYGLPEGNYCFRVQAIDHSYVGGAWSQEACCQYELCVDAIPLLCGNDTIGDTAEEELINRISEYFICTDTASDFFMPELIYRITDFAVDQNTHNIYVGLSELGDELAGLDVFVIENCNAGPESELMPVCIDYVIRLDDEPLPMITIPNTNPESEYFVIVDSKNTPGDFRLSLSCPGACADSDPLICQEIRNTSTDSGSTSISSYYFPDSSQYIDNYAGPDFKVLFTAPRSGSYTISLDSLEENLDLFILGECSPFMGLAYSRSMGTNQEEINLILDSLETIYLVVDAAKGISSTFSLSVDCCNAKESTIFYGNEDDEMVICKMEDHVDTIHFFSTPEQTVPYTYLLTDTNDIYIDEIQSPFSIQDLPKAKYHIYGVAYENSIVIDPGNPVSTIGGDICAVLSDNYLTLDIDTTYRTDIDTLLCVNERLTICDTVLSEAGDHQVFCKSKSGCDSIIDVTIRFDTLNAIIEGNNFYCAGESTQLTVTPEFASYQWSNGATEQSVLVSRAGLHSVTVTSEQNCIDSVSLEIMEVEELFPNVGDDTTICEGDLFRLDGGDFDKLLWSTGDTSRFIDVLAEGTYYVTVSDQAGCTGSDSIKVTSIPSPVANAGTDSIICDGECVILRGTGGEVCQWLPTLNFDGSGSCEIQVCPRETTTYDLVVFAEENGKTCYDTNRIQVNVFDDDSGINLIEDTVVCVGSSLQLVNSLACSDCRCDWSTTTGFNDPASCEPSVEVNENSFFSVTATNNNGCSSSDSVNIQVVASPDASTNITETIICSGDEIILEGTGGSNCFWYDTSGATLSTNCTYIPPTSDGLKILFVAENQGIVDCYDTAQVNIQTVIPPSIELIPDTTICSGEAINLLSSSDCSECICTWSEMVGLDNASVCDPSASPVIDTRYVLTSTKEAVCQVQDTVNVSVIPPVQLTLINDHTSLRQNNEVTVDLLANDTIIGSQDLEISLTRLEEQPRDVDLRLNGQDLTASAGGAFLGLFDFDYVVRDLRCEQESVGTAEILVIQSDKVCLCNPDIEPEGCGIIPNIDEYGNNDITIFDREGNIVHIARPYMNDWQGINIQTGERVPTGSYYFVLNLRENTTSPREPTQDEPIRGVITIVRR